MRVPVIPGFPRDTAVSRCRIKHRDTAGADTCHLECLILLSHPRPELVGVATPLVVNRLSVRLLPRDDIVIIGAHPRVHRRQHDLKVFGADCLRKFAAQLGLLNHILGCLTLV